MLCSKPCGILPALLKSQGSNCSGSQLLLLPQLPFLPGTYLTSTTLPCFPEDIRPTLTSRCLHLLFLPMEHFLTCALLFCTSFCICWHVISSERPFPIFHLTFPSGDVLHPLAFFSLLQSTSYNSIMYFFKLMFQFLSPPLECSFLRTQTPLYPNILLSDQLRKFIE